MPGFVSRDDLINEITVNGKQDLWNFYKVAPAAAEAAGVWQSLWKGVGNPGAGADPAATPGTAYDSDAGANVAGSMWFPDRSADLRYLLSFGACATQNCTLMLYDRLVGVSGISTASTGNKTINSTALTRYTGTAAALNEVWCEVTTATTTTAPIVSLNQYTSADGTTGQSGGTVTFPAVATDLHSLIQVPLSASKQGVRSVEVGLNVGTASAAGAVNVMILRPLARIPLLANAWNEVSLLDDTMGLPRVFDNAALGLALLASVTTATTVWGQVNCAYG
jgi:hypothetical protein